MNHKEFEDVRINAPRLHASIETMAQIGATDGGGVTRLALTQADKQARDLLWQWIEDAGLTVRVDDFGNMTGRRKGKAPVRPVVTGSHLDSVQRGGKWDGSLGVLGALEVIRTLNDHSITTERPIELVNFTCEEGSRFEPAMIGSGGIAGAFDREFVYRRTDADGITFETALNEIGYAGTKDNRPVHGVAFVELHNEQNPLLEDADVPVGVVEGVNGITWWEVIAEGEADNGPTPMTHRRDALVTAAEVVSGIRALALQTGRGATGLVGRLHVEPDQVNVVPARVTLSVDLRHQELSVIERMIDDFHKLLDEVGTKYKVQLSATKLWLSEPTPFDPSVIESIDHACHDVGIPTSRLWSGPGHDAKYMQSICPSAMIFVRSHRGKSHSEEEYSDPEDVEASVNALLHTILKLAQGDAE